MSAVSVGEWEKLMAPLSGAAARAKAEIEDLHLSLASDLDVLRLEIAMHDPARVSGF